MLEKIKKLIESTEGLEVNFKVGKESELIIKGDFLTMMKMVAELQEMGVKNSDNNARIRILEEEIKDLKRS